MIVSIISVYLFLLILLRRFVNDKIGRAVSLFYLSFWMLSILVCYLNPYGYFEVTTRTYVLLISHVAFFVLGFILIKGNSDQKIIPMDDMQVSEILKNWVFLALFAASFIFVFYMYLRQRVLLAFYSLADVRNEWIDLVLQSNHLSYMFYNTVCTIMYHFCLCLVMYMLFFERKWFPMIIMLAYVLVYSMFSGGRNQFMTIIVYFFIMWIMADFVKITKEQQFTRFQLPRLFWVILPTVILLVFLGMTAITAMRNGEMALNKENLSEGADELTMKFVEYSVGPMVAFDLAINGEVHVYDEHQKYYGVATFNGLDYLLWIVKRRLGYQPISIYDQTTGRLQNEFISISPERAWNYAYTSCMYYYYDFGAFGLFLLPFLFGIVCRLMINRLYGKSMNLFDIALVMYLFFNIYMSVFSGYLHKMCSPLYIIVLLWISIVRKRKFSSQ